MFIHRWFISSQLHIFLYRLFLPIRFFFFIFLNAIYCKIYDFKFKVFLLFYLPTIENWCVGAARYCCIFFFSQRTNKNTKIYYLLNVQRTYHHSKLESIEVIQTFFIDDKSDRKMFFTRFLFDQKAKKKNEKLVRCRKWRQITEKKQ